MKNKKKGILLMILSLVVIVSSLAFFTDSHIDTINNKMGSLSIETNLTSENNLTDLAPGDSLFLDLNVLNTGSLDSLIKTTYIISVEEQSFEKYKLDQLSLFVDNNKVLGQVNVEGRYEENVLKSKEYKDYSIKLDIDESILNILQKESFKVSVLTEAKQENSDEWIQLREEVINFGPDGNFKVVPSNNVIKSDQLSIRRGYVDGFTTPGYVSTNLKELESYPVGEYKGKFLNNQNHLNVYSSDGVLLDQTDKAYPGSLVKLEIDGVVYDELEVVLKGDIDRNGYINMTDVAIASNAYQTYISGKSVDSKDLVILDIDDDGYLSKNDLSFILKHVGNVVDEDFPSYYPQKPKLRNKPFYTIKASSDSDLDWEIDRPLDFDLRNGSYVSAGDIITLAIDVSNLKGIELKSTGVLLSISENNAEFLKEVDLDTNEGDELLVMYPKRSEDIRPRGWVDSIIKTEGDNKIFLSGDHSSHTSSISTDGAYYYVPIKVSEDAVSGTSLDLSLSNMDFTYEAFKGLSFFDQSDRTQTISLRVK